MSYPHYDSVIADLVQTAEEGLWIGGRATGGASGDRMVVLDPGTSKSIATVPVASSVDIDRAVGAARAALKGPWAKMAPADRGAVLNRVAALLRRDGDKLGALETINSGKPLRDGKSEVMSAAAYFDYYGGSADKLEGTTVPQAPGVLSMVLREPIGVSAQILPSNYPLGTAARGFAPALAAGCTIVAKPADETPLTALILARLFVEAGLPAGVLNVVTGTGALTGSLLAASENIEQITFTGSLATGRLIMKAAAHNVVPVALELGGKSPLVVLADADLDRAAATIVKHIFTHSGQVCSAASRLVVEECVAGPLLEKVIARTRSLVVDHGLADRDLGSIMSARQLEHIVNSVAGASAHGAEILVGGQRENVLNHPAGFYFQPTVMLLSDDTEAAASEELFGPVLSVLMASDSDHALEIANTGQYGLVAGVFTSSIDQALRFVVAVEAGQVYVNDWHIGGVQAPFGGVKRSGIGRERGLVALEKYQRLKSVNLRIAG